MSNKQQHDNSKNNNNNNMSLRLTPNARIALPMYKRPLTAADETWQLYSTQRDL
jgi:hypothetical protein